MSLKLLLEHFDLLAESPRGGISLRHLILALAIRGKLTPPSPGRETGMDVLKKLLLLNKKGINVDEPMSPPLLEEFTLPDHWAWCRVRNVCELRTGATPSTKRKDFFGGQIRWLVSGDIHKREISDCDGRITEEGLKNSNCKMLPVDSVLIALNGQGKTRATVALLRTPAACNQSLVSMTPRDTSLLLPDFLFYSLKYRYLEIRNITGHKQRRGLNMKLVGDLSIPLPPTGEQDRIVTKVNQLMALCDELENKQKKRNEVCISLNTSALDHLLAAKAPQDVDGHWQRISANFDLLYDKPETISKLRQAILQLAVHGKLVPQDPKAEPASVLLEKIKTEKERLIKEKKNKRSDLLPPITERNAPNKLPKGWAWTRFGDIVVNRDGERIPLERSVRARRQGNYDYYGASGVIDKIDEYIFEKPLLLIGEDGANLVNRSTPIAFIATGKYWVNNHAHVLDGISVELLEYLKLYINAIDLTPYVTGTAQPKMNQAKMNSIVVGFPPEEEQKRIVCKVKSLMLACNELESALTIAEMAGNEFVEALVRRVV